MVIKSKKDSKGKTVKNSTVSSSSSTSTTAAATTSSTIATSSSTTSRDNRHSYIKSSPSPQGVSGKTIAGVTITEVSSSSLDAGGLGTVDSSKCVVVQPDQAVATAIDNLLTEGRLGTTQQPHQLAHYTTKNSGSITSEFITQEKSSSFFEKRGEVVYTVGDSVITETQKPITQIIESEYSAQSSKYAKYGNGDGKHGDAVLVPLIDQSSSSSKFYAFTDIDNLQNKQIRNTATTTNVIDGTQQTSSTSSNTTEANKSTSTDYKQSQLTADKTDAAVDKLVDRDLGNSNISKSYNVQTITATTAAGATTSADKLDTEQKTKFDRNKGNWDGTFTYEKKVEAGRATSLAGIFGGGNSKTSDKNQTASSSSKTTTTTTAATNVDKKKNVYGTDVISTVNVSSGDQLDKTITSSSLHEVFEQVEKVGGHEYDIKYSVDKLHSNKINSSNFTEEQYIENVVITKDLKTTTESSDFKHIADFDYKNSVKNTNLDNSILNTTDYSTIIESNNLRSDAYAPDHIKLGDTVTTYTSKAYDDKSKKWYIVDESIVNEGNIISTESRSNNNATAATTTATSTTLGSSTSSATNKKTINDLATAKTKIVNNKKTTATSKSTVKDESKTTNKATVSQQLYDEKTKSWVDVDEKTFKSKRPSLIRYVSQDNDGKYTTIYKKKMYDKRTGTWKVVEEKSYKNNYFNEHIPEVIDDVTNTTTTTYVTKVFDTKTNTWKIVDEQSFTDTKTVVPADIAEEIARDQADIANIITTTEITKVKLFNIFFLLFIFSSFLFDSIYLCVLV